MTAITILFGLTCTAAVGGLGLFFVAHEERIVRRLMAEVSPPETSLPPPYETRAGLANEDMARQQVAATFYRNDGFIR